MVVHVITFIGGLIFVAPGLSMLRNARHLLTQGVEADGIVIGIAEDNQGDGITYAPIVRFIEAREARAITFTETTFSRPLPQKYRAGNVVRLVYDPEKPEKARVKSTSNLIFLPAILIIFGLAC